MKMKNETYDALVYVAQIFLPALATLVITVFTIWGMPYGELISGTIMAFDAFLGALLKISNNNYKKES